MNEQKQGNEGLLGLADALKENNILSANTSANISLLLNEVSMHSAFLANSAGPSFLVNTPDLLNSLIEKIVTIGSIISDGNKRLFESINNLVSGNMSIEKILKDSFVYEKKKDADDALDEKENEAEIASKKKKKSLLDPLGDLSKFIKKALKNSTDFSFKGILTTFLFSIGFTAGLITDTFTRIFNIFKGVLKTVASGSDIIQYVKALYDTLKTNIGIIFNVIKASIQENTIFKTVKSVFDGVNAFFSRVLGLFKSGDKITTIGKIFGSIVSKIGGVFNKIFTNVFSFIKPLLNGFKAGKAFIGVLGKLALPLAAATSVIAGIIGAFKGFTETEGSFVDKLLGGFKGLLVGIFDNLIGGLLNLVKDGLGYVLGLLGFDNLKKLFYQFDFSKAFSTLIDWFMGFASYMLDFFISLPERISSFGNIIIAWFANLPNVINEQIMIGLNAMNEMFLSLGESLGAAFSSLGDIGNKFLKWVLRLALPDPNADYSTFDPRNIARNIIPKEVFDFAFSEEPKKETEPKNQTIMTLPVAQTGQALVEAGNKSQTNNITIVNAPNNGGNVTNVSASSQINNARVSAPIITGSTYDF